MDDLVILNYNTSEIHFYKVDSQVTIDETYIDSLGHNPDECSWMQGEYIDIIRHNGIITD